MRKIVILGSIGSGKSTTANTLAQGDYFTVGIEGNSRITTKVKSKQANDDLIVFDCPGFDDPMVDQEGSFFNKEIIKCKKDFLDSAPIDAFILVVMFDQNNAPAFQDSAKQFVRSFGGEALKSLIILCIQGNEKIRYAQDDFDEVIKKSEVYEYLTTKNEKPVPYCLWDNYRPYFKQAKAIEECFDGLQQFNRLMMRFALEMMENDIESKSGNS